jgi:hypothetical protein
MESRLTLAIAAAAVFSLSVAVAVASDKAPGRMLETLARPTGTWISEDRVIHGIRPIGAAEVEEMQHSYQITFSARPASGGVLALRTERVISAPDLATAIHIGVEHLGTQGWIDAQAVGLHLLR